MNICMIGAGYVGLVSAACFSEFGWTVTCVENDAARLADLKAGKSPIYEPGLDDLVQRNMKAGRLIFTDDLGPSASNADIVLLAVGTPMRRGDGYADLAVEMVDKIGSKRLVEEFQARAVHKLQRHDC